MKKLFGLLMLIAFTFVVTAQESTNYLKLKGKILHEYKASVQVFEYNTDTEQWAEIISKNNRSSYSMRLSTRKDYKIYFQTDQGHSKVIDIISGKPGMWIEKIDIDFKRKDSTYLTLEQEAIHKPYKFIAQKNCSYTDIAINN